MFFGCIVRSESRFVAICWPEYIGTTTDWNNRDENNRKYQINKSYYGSIKGANWKDVFPKLHEGLKNGEGFCGILGHFQGEDGLPLTKNNGNYMCAANRLVLGDWIELKKGQHVDMEVLIGEIPGGDFGSPPAD